ncbi:LolA-related protein [Accumulibacter sp.]|uniref:LolA-related protein n=1 Tax=Accumulibacter sp. TaxID=2053492 RepID=UPI002604A9B8|nr:LolA-related protein [Accumulibacter sp.]
MKRLFAGLLITVSTIPALAAWDLSQLMDELAQTRGGRARYVETRYLALLDRPLVSRGELSFTAPERLEKRTLSPRPELLLLDKDRLTIERGQQKLSIDLASQPEAQAFVDSIRAALNGDRAALERNYTLYLAGNRENWTLTLLPSSQAIATVVQRIRIGGQRNRIRSIEYLQTDGDRALMSIEPLTPK